MFDTGWTKLLRRRCGFVPRFLQRRTGDLSRAEGHLEGPAARVHVQTIGPHLVHVFGFRRSQCTLQSIQHVFSILYLDSFRSWTDVNRPDWPPGSYNCCLLDKRWPRCCGASERAGDGDVLADCSLEWLWSHIIFLSKPICKVLWRICADAEPKKIGTFEAFLKELQKTTIARHICTCSVHARDLKSFKPPN